MNETFSIALQRISGLPSSIFLVDSIGSILIRDDGRHCLNESINNYLMGFPIDFSCEADDGESEVIVDCRGTGHEAPLQCSFDGRPLHNCKFFMHMRRQ